MKKIKVVASLLSLLLAGSALFSQNLVPNPRFETLKSNSADYVYRNPQMECYNKGCPDMAYLNRYSQAENWTLWLGSLLHGACVMTELVKPGANCVPADARAALSGNLMHVKTTHGGSGIVNGQIPAGNARVKISAWVYAVKGKVYMGYGPTGASVVSTTSKLSCRWEKLEIVKSGSEFCSQIIFYSENGGDAEFYVGNVSIEKF